MREVASGIYSFTIDGRYISMFIITRDAVMVIDPMNKKHAEAMLAEIRRVSNAPIKYLVYSHNHWDHTSGGQVIKYIIQSKIRQERSYICFTFVNQSKLQLTAS